MTVKRIQLLAQIVGFVTIGVLSILGALTVASGGRPAWAALGQPPSTASFAASTVSSRVPVSNVINYQGILREPDGTPVTGAYTMTFRLYNDPVVGTAVFTDTLQNVMTRDGLFTVLLGDSEGNEIGASLFGQPLYVGIQVEDNAEMAPRQRIAPVPYAVQLTDGVYVDDEGNVGIGTTDPAVQLDVVGSMSISGIVSGDLDVDGKLTSASTVDGDSGTTITTKDYVDIRWPDGHYCILRAGGSCPPGFSPGWIYTDGEDDDPQTKGGGNVGASSYSTAGSTIEFCCK